LIEEVNDFCKFTGGRSSNPEPVQKTTETHWHSAFGSQTATCAIPFSTRAPVTWQAAERTERGARMLRDAGNMPLKECGQFQQ
jgi:hypothetical protein